MSLLPVDEVAVAVRRDWPFLATRAAVALLVPVFVTMLAKELDFYGPVAQLGLPLEFLAVGPFAYEAKVIWFVALVLVLSAFLAGKRAPQIVLALAAGAVLWTGYVFTKLQWSKLFLADYELIQQEAPSAAAWTWGALLMLAATLFAMAEAVLETRREQAKRDLDEAETRAAFEVSARAAALVAAAGVGLAAALVAAIWLLRPLARAPFRLNPVLVLFGLGVLVALAVVLAARRRTLSGATEGFFRPAARGKDLPPPPPPPPRP
ncbi:MAG TPA: hypothetical protein VHH36_01695 [Candidatus Thermoplasmatota archaeon]|nr:hypothetical protein [Candidatus Thermoplasmatota archaeon]